MVKGGTFALLQSLGATGGLAITGIVDATALGLSALGLYKVKNSVSTSV